MRRSRTSLTSFSQRSNRLKPLGASPSPKSSSAKKQPKRTKKMAKPKRAAMTTSEAGCLISKLKISVELLEKSSAG